MRARALWVAPSGRSDGPRPLSLSSTYSSKTRDSYRICKTELIWLSRCSRFGTARYFTLILWSSKIPRNQLVIWSYRSHLILSGLLKDNDRDFSMWADIQEPGWLIREVNGNLFDVPLSQPVIQIGSIHIPIPMQFNIIYNYYLLGTGSQSNTVNVWAVHTRSDMATWGLGRRLEKLITMAQVIMIHEITQRTIAMRITWKASRLSLASHSATYCCGSWWFLDDVRGLIITVSFGLKYRYFNVWEEVWTENIFQRMSSKRAFVATQYSDTQFYIARYFRTNDSSRASAHRYLDYICLIIESE